MVRLFGHSLNSVWEKKNRKPIPVAYLALELVNGGDLFEYAYAKPFDHKVARYFLQQIIEGVSYIHENGLAHRDLKPDNILLNDRNLTIKIADFGLAGPNNGIHKTYCGTGPFMAPEIRSGKYDASAVDIFALGVTVFYLCFK